MPDKSIIVKKNHSTKINQLYSNGNGKEVHDYLSTLGLKDILETAAEFAEEGHLSSSGLLLSPYLQKELDKKPALTEIEKIILDKDFNYNFRAFVLDGITHSKTIKGFNDDQIINTMLSIAKDSSEKGFLRRFALLNLRAPNSYYKKGTTDTQSELIDIFNDKNTPAEVRGAAITAMHRTGDPNFLTAVEEVLNSSSNHPDELIRCAAIEAAKSKKNKDSYTQKLREIANKTQNKDVYGSTIFSLGIIGSSDAVIAILDNYGRFEDNLSCDSALKRNYKTIISMINLNQPQKNIVLAIKAAKVAGLTPALEALEQIVASSQDQSLINIAKDAISYIKSNPASDNYQKWEVE